MQHVPTLELHNPSFNSAQHYSNSDETRIAKLGSAAQEACTCPNAAVRRPAAYALQVSKTVLERMQMDGGLALWSLLSSDIGSGFRGVEKSNQARSANHEHLQYEK